MSQDKVEVVRQIGERLDRNDWHTDLIAEDIEYVNPPYAIEPGVRYGRESFKVVRDTWEDFRFEIDEYVDAGDDVIVTLGRYTASGPSSGIQLTGEHGYVWTIRDGQAVRFEWFQSHREALEAAGVSPPK
jgi:ketosteroid isomerase-like protein